MVAMISIGLICALLIVLTYDYTLPIIKANQQEALNKAIFKVIPGIDSSQAMVWTEQSLEPAQAGDEREKVYAGYRSGELAGYAIEAKGQGYADIVRILYGYDHAAQTVVGMAVLETKETPGLGDKIEKDPGFLENFKALDVSLNSDGSALANEVITVKHGEKEHPRQIDGMTDATISSRAVGNIINSSAVVWIPRLGSAARNTDTDHTNEASNGE